MSTPDLLPDLLPHLLPVRLEELVVRRKSKALLGPVSLEIDERDDHRFIMIIGPNGSGKTTLLKLLQGLYQPNGGKIVWNIPALQAHRKISLVFQTPIMLRRSVIQNAAFALLLNNIPKKQAMAEAEKWLEQVGLSDIAERPANVLSGGEKQKLAFARAMTTNPQILLLDEPTANLDNASKLELEEFLRKVMESGTRIIMASHEMGQVKRLATSILFLNHGKVEEFSNAEIFPATQTGEKFIAGDIIL